jgi:hypothetical protein
MKTCAGSRYLPKFILELGMFQKSHRENQNTCLCSIIFSKNLAVYEIMWENMVEPDGSQMTA